MTHYGTKQAWHDAPVRPDSADWKPGLPGNWTEWKVENNVAFPVEHLLEIVGCIWCGWERLVWPEESEAFSKAHQGSHLIVASTVINVYYPQIENPEDLAREVMNAVCKPLIQEK